jgi:DNA topoisomerase-1
MSPAKPTRKASSALPAPIESAREAGLRYVYDSKPGITRHGTSPRFRYTGPDGKPLRDPETLSRIKSLVIPPAWTSVWICPTPKGHLQATGRDARGRKQSRYHPCWRTVRDEAKYEHMLQFASVLPALRAHIDKDLALPGLPREKVLATVVRLLETTFIRIGNEEYAKQNNSFGLTTLRRRHVTIRGSRVIFNFKGKSGVTHTIDVNDRRLARIVQACHDTPGYELFEYLDHDGCPHSISSTDVNEYLDTITPPDSHFTAKDFRTWAGTVFACSILRAVQPCPNQPCKTQPATTTTPSQTQLKRDIVAAIKAVAERLGNTPAVCRKCYIHPAVLDSYLTGVLPTLLHNHKPHTSALQPDEAALLHLLQQQLKPAA